MKEPFVKIFSYQRWRKVGLCAQLGFAGVAFFLAGCSPKSAPQGVVLAKVGVHEITEMDFKREAERRLMAGQTLPAKGELLQDMILHESLLQRARAIGLENDPVIRRELDNLLIGKLMDKELGRKMDAIVVSPAEIKNYYEGNAVRYTKPELIRCSILSLGVDSKASEARKEEVRMRMVEARAKVLADPPRGRGPANNGFGAFAVEYSDDQVSRYKGGDIGWLEVDNLPARLPRAVMEAGKALPIGQISDVIQTPGGVYLVMKTDRREAVTIPLGEVEGAIRQTLANQKRQVAGAAYRDESVRRASAEINQAALAALVIPANRERKAQVEMKPPLLNETPENILQDSKK
jgi:hypothetical protein